MSYILDALRKADAERERDPARGIHAQPAAAAAPRAAARAPRWLWPSAALVLLAAAGFWWQGRVPAPTRPVALQVPPVRAAAAVPVAPVAVSVSPPAPASLPAPAQRPIVKAVAVPVAAPQPLAAAKSAAPAASAPQASAAPAAPSAAAAPAPTPQRVYAFAELPADVQRDLPKLSISGGVHSENAAQRMLIVGGQVLAEGAEAAPGVVIEQIRARNAVLRFRGYRYSVGF